MSALKVSVIVPAYKAAGTIERAVDSVLGQTIPPHEILIIDDGSPDDIALPLARYGDRVTLVRKPNGGAASARNLGIDMAKGDLIAFLDADDYWEAGKLERHLEAYRRHPDLGLTCGSFFDAEPGGERRCVSHPSIEVDVPVTVSGHRAFLAATRTWTGTVVAPKALFGNDRFVSGLEPAEDRDLWFRLIGKAPICFLSQPLATAVLEPGSLSRTNVDRDCGNMLRVIRRHQKSLGGFHTRKWEAYVYRRWAANLIISRPRSAVKPAVWRLLREPISPEAWWIVAKSCGLAAIRPSAIP